MTLKRDYLGNLLPERPIMIQTRMLLFKWRISGMSPAELSRGLEDPETLAIDCRSFLLYNTGYVRGAHNIHCPSIVKRRSGGTVALSYVLTSDDVREQYMKGKFKRVVVYDECTNDLTDLNKDSNIFFVLKSLQEERGKSKLFYLQGGYKAFSQDFPHLCVSDLGERTSGETATAEKSKPESSPVEILPYLFLGDAKQALNTDQLQHLGVTAVINVSRTCNYHHLADKFQYKMIPVDDNATADISMWFEDAIAFIDNVEQKGGKTFVHCHAGVSRSATICVAYVMKHSKYSLEEAYSYVKTRRKAIGPNLNFMRQLQEYETKLLKRKNPGLSLPALPLCLPTSGQCSPVQISPLSCSPLFNNGTSVFTFSTPPASPLAQQGRMFFGSPLASPS